MGRARVLHWVPKVFIWVFCSFMMSSTIWIYCLAGMASAAIGHRPATACHGLPSARTFMLEEPDTRKDRFLFTLSFQTSLSLHLLTSKLHTEIWLCFFLRSFRSFTLTNWLSSDLSPSFDRFETLNFETLWPQGVSNFVETLTRANNKSF